MAAQIIDFRSRRVIVPAPQREKPLPYCVDVYEGSNGMVAIDTCIPAAEAQELVKRLRAMNPAGKVVYARRQRGSVDRELGQDLRRAAARRLRGGFR
jgi:hypothetical protein